MIIKQLICCMVLMILLQGCCIVIPIPVPIDPPVKILVIEEIEKDGE
jgi:hypothetical protein